MWRTRLTDCLRIFTGCRGRSVRIAYRFYRMWWTSRRLTDYLRIFTGCRGRSLRIVCGFLRDVVDEAYGLFTDFYRMWGTKLTDCLWIWTGFGGEGLRIVCRFLPDLGKEEAYGMFADFYRMWRTRLTDCLQIFTGFADFSSIEQGIRYSYKFFFISRWLCFDLDLLSTAVSNCCRIVLRPQKPISWLSDVFEWMINQCLMSLVACLVWLVACLLWLVACLVWTCLQLNKVFATRTTLLSWFLISCYGIDSTVVVWPNTSNFGIMWHRYRKPSVLLLLQIFMGAILPKLLSWRLLPIQYTVQRISSRSNRMVRTHQERNFFCW